MEGTDNSQLVVVVVAVVVAMAAVVKTVTAMAK
jgi:hypothetical protein